MSPSTNRFHSRWRWLRLSCLLALVVSQVGCLNEILVLSLLLTGPPSVTPAFEAETKKSFTDPDVTVAVEESVVKVVRGDITDMEVDAFVYDITEDLKLGSGHGSAIQQRGGVKIQEALDAIGRCPVGEAAVVVLWLSQWNREGPTARFVPEHAFAVAGCLSSDSGSRRYSPRRCHPPHPAVDRDGLPGARGARR